MITQVTQLWIEERDKIVAHCMKKSSKQKKQLQKKVQGIAPASQLMITKMFIKRCVFKYQARYITWQLNVKFKNEMENFKKKILNDIREKVIAQEKLELELFKDVTIPDLREKDGKKGKGGSAEDSKKPGKIPLTLLNIKEI